MEAVRLTNDEALQCKLSAHLTGLLPDPFVEKFAFPPSTSTSTPAHHRPHHRRHLKAPLINRGTFLRTVAIDAVCHRFLKQQPAGQIVSLGAGFDTRFFRLASRQEPAASFKYFEVDFDSVMDGKRAIITQDAELDALQAGRLFLLSGDLNDSGAFRNALLTHPSFDSSAPTLIVAECLLMYLNRERAGELISWLAGEIQCVSFVAFDPVVSDDAFSRVMLENLEARGIEEGNLCSFEGNLERFKAHFSTVQAFTMLKLEQEREFVGPDEVQAMRMKAALDEYEEWKLIAEHYCFLVASK